MDTGFADELAAVKEKSLRNELGLQSHEKECAIRYGHINDTMTGVHRSVAGVRRDVKNASMALTGILLTVLAFLLKLVFFS